MTHLQEVQDISVLHLQYVRNKEVLLKDTHVKIQVNDAKNQVHCKPFTTVLVQTQKQWKETENISMGLELAWFQEIW